jgi:FixJ family two-component response regulator
MTEEKPFVYVIDDDPSVRTALERLLRSAGYDVNTFASATEFLDFSCPDMPGCIILDIQMPKISGLELQDCLARKCVCLPIVFITGHGTIPASVRALKAGAMDFLQKPFEGSELLDAVSRGIEKHRRLRQEQNVLKVLRARAATLTPREREVFGLVVSGMLNKQVAFDLGTAEKTIKVHRARVMEKMCAQSLADLVRFAEKIGTYPSGSKHQAVESKQ